ncbi:MAG TPA: hypothetical protein VIT88_01565 [Pyrinomonadaceae bacterium]
MKKAKLNVIVALLIVCASASAALAQEDGGGVVVLKCGWHKERIRPRPSVATLASQEELVQQSQRQQQLAIARNTNNRGRAGRIEDQISNHQKATNKASQTELPRDGYRYKVKLQNDGSKTIQSIDWDYIFIDPTDQRELARHQFTSDDTIKPGKSKEISVLYLNPPVKTLSAPLLNEKSPIAIVERAEIIRLKFSDGSSWQRP